MIELQRERERLGRLYNLVRVCRFLSTGFLLIAGPSSPTGDTGTFNGATSATRQEQRDYILLLLYVTYKPVI